MCVAVPPYKVTEATKKVADAYGVKFVAGTQMEQITRCGLGFASAARRVDGLSIFS